MADHRSDFAHPSRFPGSTVIAENFSIALKNLPLGPSAYVVIITRGHEHDVDCLMEILPQNVAYVGLIGSRRRVRFVLEWLEKNGFSRQRLNDVFTPIGIPIGVVVNRVGIGDERVHAFCKEENVPVLLEIPDDRRIAEAYSKGRLIVEALPEYRGLFESLLEMTIHWKNAMGV